MDTKTVAAAIGTTPFALRKFLRDERSTFRPVGSGARYDFRDSEIEEIARRYSEWSGGKPQRPVVLPTPNADAPTQADIDQAVWAEEEQTRAALGLGPVKLGDLRNPRERDRIRRQAEERARRLDERLLAAGLHISQQRPVMQRRAS